MFPEITVGSIHFHTYGLLNAVALLVAGMYGFYRLLNGLRVPDRVVIKGVILTILGGFVGIFLVRLVLVLQNLLRTGELAWAEGNSFIGLLVFGSGTAVLYVKKNRVPLGQAFDLGGIVLPLGQFIARFACLGAGCCYGRETDSWLAMYLPGADGIWQDRYPTQLLSAGANLLIFAFLIYFERYALRRRQGMPAGDSRLWPFDGFLFLLYVDLYLVKRFIIEFLRGDTIPAFGPVSWVQLYTVAGVVVVSALMAWNWRRRPE